MASPLTAVKFHSTKADGTDNAAGKIFTYAAGTTTPQATYTTSGGGTPNANPVILDGTGRASIYLDPGLSYKFVCQDSLGASVPDGTVDNWADRGDILRQDLASTTDAAKGAGLVGYASTLAYASGTIGLAVKDLQASYQVLTGADPTGVADSTAAIKALFDYCIPNKLQAVIPGGTYLVSGTVCSATYASGSLILLLAGDVTINVNAASAAFDSLIRCETTAASSITITGGRLTIVGNSKVGSAIYARHYGQGGMVNVENVKVSGCKNVNFAVENAGVYLYGRWVAGRLGVIEVDGVDRSGTGTASRGVLIADAGGPFTIESLKVSNVLSTGFTSDADGLYFSGYTSGASTTQREGSLTVQRAEFIDCQGRSIKAQHQDVVLRDVTVRRQLVTTFSVPDIDFQLGGGQIDTLLLQYIKNGGASPLNATFYPLASQHNCTDRVTTCRIGKVTLRSEMQLPRLVQVVVGATALDGGTMVDDVSLLPYGSFTGSFFARCVLEFDAGQVVASSNKTYLSVRNVRGDMSGIPILGHTGYSTTVATKLSVDAIGNNNTGTPDANNKSIAATSGGDIPAFLQFNFNGNIGFHALMMSTFAFDTQKLADGCRFSYIRATATVTNGPAIAAGTYVDVECLGSINGTSRKVRMTVDNGGTMDEWYTQSGAWGVIK